MCDTSSGLNTVICCCAVPFFFIFNHWIWYFMIKTRSGCQREVLRSFHIQVLLLPHGELLPESQGHQNNQKFRSFRVKIDNFVKVIVIHYNTYITSRVFGELPHTYCNTLVTPKVDETPITLIFNPFPSLRR